MKTSCPGREELLRFFEGEMSPEEKDALIDHQFGCPECRVKFEVLVAVRREVRGKIEELAAADLEPGKLRTAKKIAREKLREHGRGRRLFAFWPGISPAAKYTAAAAAAILLILGVVAVGIFKPSDRPATFRDRNLGRTVRLIYPKGEIDAPPDKFVWEPVKGQENYDFRLMDEDLKTIPIPYGEDNIILSPDGKELSLILEESQKKSFVRGRVYIWAVAARNEIAELIAFARESFIIKIK